MNERVAGRPTTGSKAIRDNVSVARHLGGFVLTMPGYEAGNFALDPVPGDPTGKRWTLKIAFKKASAPIRR
jgi:hypothetical protein